MPPCPLLPFRAFLQGLFAFDPGDQRLGLREGDER